MNSLTGFAPEGSRCLARNSYISPRTPFENLVSSLLKPWAPGVVAKSVRRFSCGVTCHREPPLASQLG